MPFLSPPKAAFTGHFDICDTYRGANRFENMAVVGGTAKPTAGVRRGDIFVDTNGDSAVCAVGDTYSILLAVTAAGPVWKCLYDE